MPSQCRWLNSPNPWYAVPGPEKPANAGLIGLSAEVRPMRLLSRSRLAIEPAAMSVIDTQFSTSSCSNMPELPKHIRYAR
jgi:hypothetical protein